MFEERDISAVCRRIGIHLRRGNRDQAIEAMNEGMDSLEYANTPLLDRLVIDIDVNLGQLADDFFGYPVTMRNLLAVDRDVPLEWNNVGEGTINKLSRLFEKDGYTW